MATAAILTERLIEATGLNAADMRLRARYLREAGLLPDAWKGWRRGRTRPPQIETVHATVLALAALTTGVPQVHAPAAVRDLWMLEPLNPHPGAAATHFFGEWVASYMELATRPELRGGIQSAFLSLNVAQDRPYAAIQPHPPAETRHFIALDRQPASHLVPIQRLCVTGPEILLLLGEVVMQSRREATQLGVTIPVAEAWRALGASAPVDFSDALPAVSADENAATPARATAPAP